MQTECYKETFFVKIVSILKNNTIFASVLSQKNMTDVKENIINVTVDLMCKVGIKSITVDDIAQQLGISKKTFYQHFANKEELVELVLTILEQKQSERINKYLSNSNFIDVVMYAFHFYNNVAPTLHKTPSFVYDLHKYYPQLEKVHIQNTRQNQINFLREMLQRGKKEGFLWEDLEVEITANLLNMLYENVLHKMILEEEKDQVAVFIRNILKIFAKGLLSPFGEEQIQKQLNKKDI